LAPSAWWLEAHRKGDRLLEARRHDSCTCISSGLSTCVNPIDKEKDWTKKKKKTIILQCKRMKKKIGREKRKYLGFSLPFVPYHYGKKRSP
jgi:hypothetical protein